MTATLDDYRWLTSSAAEPYLVRTRESTGSLTSQTKSLRRDLSPERTHLVLEQAELRQRARIKFRHAEQMFFTRQALQQATSETIADCTAARFPAGEPVVDLCCGIGGNLIALARRGAARGVEKDPVVAFLAQANAEALGLRNAGVVVADAAQYELGGGQACFADPDRRSQGRRTVDLQYYCPPLPVLQRLVHQSGNCAIKLAPATAVPEDWRDQSELQWIGDRRECKQQVVWFGPLAAQPGRRVATICRAGEVASVVEHTCPERSSAEEFHQYIAVVHACVVAARLVPSLAAQCEMTPVAGAADLLTGDSPSDHSALMLFEVVTECPARIPTIRSHLNDRDIAAWIVRGSGRRDSAKRVSQQLRGIGSQPGGVFILDRGSRKVAAIAVRR